MPLRSWNRGGGGGVGVGWAGGVDWGHRSQDSCRNHAAEIVESWWGGGCGLGWGGVGRGCGLGWGGVGWGGVSLCLHLIMPVPVHVNMSVMSVQLNMSVWIVCSAARFVCVCVCKQTCLEAVVDDMILPMTGSDDDMHDLDGGFVIC